MEKEKLIDLMLMHIRNIWSVDGLYFINIEDRRGTEEATEIDRSVWRVMGKLEARRLKQVLNIDGDDIQTVMRTLLMTGWALDLENKEASVEEGVFRNRDCRVQRTRMSKGLGEFACKNVRWDYLKSFAREFSPDIEVECVVCPPDDHPEDLWCEWRFVKR